MKLDHGRILTSGSRVVTIVGLGDTLAQAVHQAYLGMQSMEFKSNVLSEGHGKKVSTGVYHEGRY